MISVGGVRAQAMPYALKGLGIFLRDWFGYYLVRVLVALFLFEFIFWLYLRELGGEDPNTRTGLLAWEGMRKTNTERLLDERLPPLKEGYFVLALLGEVFQILLGAVILLEFGKICGILG